MSSVFKFDDKVIYLENVQFIKTIDDYDQVYMTLGMVHIPAKFKITKAFEKWAENKEKPPITIEYNGEDSDFEVVVEEEDMDLI